MAYHPERKCIQSLGVHEECGGASGRVQLAHVAVPCHSNTAMNYSQPSGSLDVVRRFNPRQVSI